MRYLILFALFLLPNAAFAVTYATWNSADKSASVSLSGGDLTATKTTSDGWAGVRSTISKSSGKWYWEVTMTVLSAPNTAGHFFGVANSSYNFNGDASTGNVTAFQNGQGGYFECTTTETSGYGNGDADDVYGIALDKDGGEIDVYRNDVLLKNCTSLPSGDTYAMWSAYKNTDSAITNFGASAFVYTPPSGYEAGLCDTAPCTATAETIIPILSLVRAFWIW